jgi:iron complex transport system substrate-binding protein
LSPTRGFFVAASFSTKETAHAAHRSHYHPAAARGPGPAGRGLRAARRPGDGHARAAHACADPDRAGRHQRHRRAWPFGHAGGPRSRIVSLAPSNTEALFTLGVGDRLIGRDEFSDYPPEALEVTSIGSLYPSVNTEAVVALEPDLVLAAGITNPEDVERLAELGLTVYSTRINSSLDDIYTDLLDIGALTGRAAEAEALVDSLKARVAAVTSATSAVAEKPVVFYEIDATEPSKPWTSGPNSFIGQLIGMAGGVNAGDIASDQYAQLSLEQLVAQDPDVIILGSSTYGGQTPALVAARTGWETISAVQNGAVYTFDDNLVSRPGPRVVDGLEQLARLIHPELFE